jgi:hypothetical protein
MEGDTLRQRLSRFVRKTLSFSKSEQSHELVTRWFIILYNLEIKTSLTRERVPCVKRSYNMSS